jgi:hypothetical protein
MIIHRRDIRTKLASILEMLMANRGVYMPDTLNEEPVSPEVEDAG